MFDNIHDMDNVNFLCSSGGQWLVVARSISMVDGR